MSAWKEVIEKVLPAKYVYEFDLKNFFGEVSIKAISEELGKFGVPTHIIRYLEEMSRWSVPTLQMVDLVDESAFRLKAEFLREDKMYLEDLRMYEQLDPLFADIPNQGVPQGGSLSPFLSTTVLESTILKYQDTVQYADDGI
jgi:hypothetical protein